MFWLGLAAALVTAVMAVFYVVDIIRGSTRPHRVTWGVWALIGILGFGTAEAGGAGPGAYVAGVYIVLQVVVFALSLVPRYGARGSERGSRDWLAAALAVVAVVLWRVDFLGLAAATVVVADAIALWPTLRKTWRRPDTEPAWIWTVDAVAATVAAIVAAKSDSSFAAWAYPLYLAVGNWVVAGVIAIRERRLELVTSAQALEGPS